MSLDATQSKKGKAITLPYPPQANHLYAVVRGRKVLSREGRQYREASAAMALSQGMRPIDAGEVVVKLKAFRPRRAGDLDNVLKASLDSLKGIAWSDDKQIVRIEADRFDDKHNPRVEIEVFSLAGEECSQEGKR